MKTRDPFAAIPLPSGETLHLRECTECTVHNLCDAEVVDELKRLLSRRRAGVDACRDCLLRARDYQREKRKEST